MTAGSWCRKPSSVVVQISNKKDVNGIVCLENCCQCSRIQKAVVCTMQAGIHSSVIRPGRATALEGLHPTSSTLSIVAALLEVITQASPFPPGFHGTWLHGGQGTTS